MELTSFRKTDAKDLALIIHYQMQDQGNDLHGRGFSDTKANATDIVYSTTF